ncbi:MAG: hypothetical protein MUO31_00925 [Thermodesulfovibrionales bacterium]|nr:hypothetical protein [Thermodesulfovibrionales bacterium]
MKFSDHHLQRCLEVLKEINQGIPGIDLAKKHKVKPGTISKWKNKANKYLTSIQGSPISKTKEIKEIKNKTVNTSHTSFLVTSTNTPPGGDIPGILKLTEEILEDALVRVLQQDPAKALGPALAFLDKKKSLSINDDDTQQTEDQKTYYNEVLKNVYS